MSTEQFALNLEPETLARLTRAAEASGESPEALAVQLVEEGLRLQRHPGIVFRNGPTGRRAALPYGADVWEIVPLFDDFRQGREQAIREAARCLNRPEYELAAVARYYEEFRDEIDERIRSNRELADRLEADWLREQKTLAS